MNNRKLNVAGSNLIRCKRICNHANPLFEQWLKSWKVEAEKRGSNMKYNYQRAINSLKKYPLPLYSGRECSVLDHFGEKICQYIDNKIEEHVQMHGPIRWEDYIKVNDFRRKKRKSLNTISPTPKRISIKKTNKSRPDKPPKPRAGKGKQYTPGYRSGAYALLISLYQESKSANNSGYLTKSQLIDEAQHLCDASFTTPAEGSHYTAWASMFTLTKKGLVQKSSNPAKYALTEEGSALASILLSNRNDPLPPSTPSGITASNDFPGIQLSLQSPSRGSTSNGATSSKSFHSANYHDISSSSEEENLNQYSRDRPNYIDLNSDAYGLKSMNNLDKNSGNVHSRINNIPTARKNNSDIDNLDIGNRNILKEKYGIADVIIGNNTKKSADIDLEILDDKSCYNPSTEKSVNFGAEILESGTYDPKETYGFPEDGISDAKLSDLSDSEKENDEVQVLGEENSNRPPKKCVSNDLKITGSNRLFDGSAAKGSFHAKSTPDLDKNDFKFCYADADGNEVLLKEQAMVSIDELNGSALFLIKARLVDLLRSSLDYQLHDDRSAPPGFSYAFISDFCAPDVSPSLADSNPYQATGRDPAVSRENSHISSNKVDLTKEGTQSSFSSLLHEGTRSFSAEDDIPDLPDVVMHSPPARLDSPAPLIDISREDSDESSSDIKEIQTFPSQSLDGFKKQRHRTTSKATAKPNFSTVQGICNSQEMLNSQNNEPTSSQVSSLPSTSSYSDIPDLKIRSRENTAKHFNSQISSTNVENPPKTVASDHRILYSFAKGSFKIVLNVDNQEVYGGFSSGSSKNSKTIITSELSRNGVEFQVRNLNVGDFAWTCQSLGSQHDSRELVLPFVVERKRMDDLAGSIRDGRFREQKFRLRRSGVPRPVYLVEEKGSQHATVPLSSCLQAVTNTQVVDGFSVKMTKDAKESAAYLTVMTRYLQNKLKDKMVHCLSPESAWGVCGSDLEGPAVFGREFAEFNAGAAKNRPMTVKEMLAKQLIQIHGASLDKVAAVVEMYPTPRCLAEALLSIPEESRDVLLRDLKSKKSGRAIDQNVSAAVAKLYTWDEFPN